MSPATKPSSSFHAQDAAIMLGIGLIAGAVLGMIATLVIDYAVLSNNSSLSHAAGLTPTESFVTLKEFLLFIAGGAVVVGIGAAYLGAKGDRI